MRVVKRVRVPLRIAAAYFGAGCLWILASDWLLGRVGADGPMIGQTAKGLLFVALSSVLIYVLTDQSVRAVRRSEAERERLDQRLRATARLEALGQLTGGIAHDFNNLITAISGNLDLYLTGGSEGAEAQELHEARRSLSRATDLTRQLLSAGRYRVSRPEPVDVSAVLEELANLLHRLIGDHIWIHKDLHDQLPAVMIDPGQLEQVVMNLCINARDAMPSGGVLVLRTGEHRHEEGAPAGLPEPVVEGGSALQRCVVIEVSDSGVGIPDEVRDRIFEPFFTTKPPDVGTGLGLSTVQAIVRQAGGRMEVESSADVGTTFRVLLPASARPASVPAEEPVSGRTTMFQSSATVVVAEDDPAVRSLVVRVLERRGYSVLAAADGREAFELLRARAPEVDLLLSDSAMPEISGIELIEAARRLRPGLPVLLMSGYAAQELRPGVPYLEKPFAPADLEQRVQQLLTRKASS